MIRWPLFCTRCGSVTHYAEDCKIPSIGMCEAEREMVDAERRDRNCVLGIVGVLMIGYLALVAIGGVA